MSHAKEPLYIVGNKMGVWGNRLGLHKIGRMKRDKKFKKIRSGKETEGKTVFRHNNQLYRVHIVIS